MVIPDGDRRYAKKFGISKDEAYKKAGKVLRKLIEWVLIDCNAEEFTFFGLSYANMEKRENGDLKPILDAQTLTLKEFTKDRFFERNGIQVKVFGEKQILPSEYQEAINKIEEATGYYEDNKRVNLLLAFSGAKDLENAINKTTFEKKALTAPNINDNCCIKIPIDLIIRTADEKRISDGPLLATSYSEIYSVKPYFPELKKSHIIKAIKAFESKERTFGK